MLEVHVLVVSLETEFQRENGLASSDAVHFVYDDHDSEKPLPVDDVPVKIGVDTSNQNTQQSVNDYCANVQSDTKTRVKTLNFLQTINSKVVDAVNQCVGSPGLHVWLQMGADPHQFFVYAIFHSTSERPDAQTAEIKSLQIEPKNTDCPNRWNKKEHIAGNGGHFLCTRKSADAVAVVVNATEKVVEDSRLVLPPIPQRTSSSQVLGDATIQNGPMRCKTQMQSTGCCGTGRGRQRQYKKLVL